jgi:hypothetical protein
VFLVSGFFLFFAGVSGWAQDCDSSRYSGVGQSLSVLEGQQHCLNEKLKRLEFSHDYLGDILELRERLERTELRLHTAESKIEMLEERIKMLEFSPWMMPRPASKPNAAASKPTPDANEAKAPADKPKPVVDSPKVQ